MEGRLRWLEVWTYEFVFQLRECGMLKELLGVWAIMNLRGCCCCLGRIAGNSIVLGVVSDTWVL